MIEFSCTLDYQAYLDYFRHTQRKTIRIYKILGICFCIYAILYAITIFVPPIIMEELSFDIIYSLLFLVLGFYFIFGLKSLTLKIFKRTYTTNKFLQASPVVTYQFNESNFKMLTTSSLSLEECTYSYEMIFSAVETQKYIYLKISSNAAYIINKSTISDEQLKGIRELLVNKLTNRYIIEMK